MFNRVSISAIVAALCFLLCGEAWSYGYEAGTTTLAARQLEEITDADMTSPASALTGQSTSRSITNSNRSSQRTNGKRSEVVSITAGAESLGTIIESAHRVIKPNILGGIVAKRAFYSLCCLRI